MTRGSTTGRSSRHPLSWWVVVAAGSLIIVFAVAMVREAVKSSQVRRQIKTLRQAVAAEENRHGQLESLIAYLSSPTFQEREARLKLGLKKSGERVIVVPPQTNTNESSGAAGSGAEEGAAGDVAASNAKRWWQYFFPPNGLHKPENSS